MPIPLALLPMPAAIAIARSVSRLDRMTSSPRAAARLAISSPMPDVPPITSKVFCSATALSIFGQLVAQVLPVTGEPVGIPGRRLWRLGFQPSHRSLAGVSESVRAPDTGPGDIADFKPVQLTVKLCVSCSFEDQVGLLEWVIVLASPAVWVVLNHEHGRQLRAEVAVGHHLDGDAAVDEQSGAHARGDSEQILALPTDIHVVSGDVAKAAVAPISNIDRRGHASRERNEEGVVAVPRSGRGSLHLSPRHGDGTVVAPGMRGPNRD